MAKENVEIMKIMAISMARIMAKKRVISANENNGGSVAIMWL
jgi:hypothetical protein